MKDWQPGRELDTEIASVAMEWKVIDDHEPLRLHKMDGGVITSSGPEKFPVVGSIPAAWRPSTNLLDAFDVEAAMFTRGFRFRFGRGGDSSFACWCYHYNDLGYIDLSTPVFMNASLAFCICAVALGALEIQQQEQQRV